jgi:acyl-CoA-binding protein
MAELIERFQKATEDVKKLTERPDNAILLQLYALFKQGTEGDASGKRPGLTDFKGRVKFDAWTQLKGKSKEGAMQEYIALVEGLMAKAGSYK